MNIFQLEMFYMTYLNFFITKESTNFEIIILTAYSKHIEAKTSPELKIWY